MVMGTMAGRDEVKISAFPRDRAFDVFHQAALFSNAVARSVHDNFSFHYGMNDLPSIPKEEVAEEIVTPDGALRSVIKNECIEFQTCKTVCTASERLEGLVSSGKIPAEAASGMRAEADRIFRVARVLANEYLEMLAEGEWQSIRGYWPERRAEKMDIAKHDKDSNGAVTVREVTADLYRQNPQITAGELTLKAQQVFISAIAHDTRRKMESFEELRRGPHAFIIPGAVFGCLGLVIYYVGAVEGLSFLPVLLPAWLPAWLPTLGVILGLTILGGLALRSRSSDPIWENRFDSYRLIRYE